jgi:hypothetical protein
MGSIRADHSGGFLQAVLQVAILIADRIPGIVVIHCAKCRDSFAVDLCSGAEPQDLLPRKFKWKPAFP